MAILLLLKQWVSNMVSCMSKARNHVKLIQCHLKPWYIDYCDSQRSRVKDWNRGSGNPRKQTQKVARWYGTNRRVFMSLKVEEYSV